jgi:Ca2+-binding RTX toxin-like protein
LDADFSSAARTGIGYRTACAVRVFKLNGMPSARRVLGAALVAASLAGLSASAAGAAEVRLDRLSRDCRVPCSPSYFEELVVRGGSGEANRLSVARGEAGEFQVTDVGASLRAGPGCTAVAQQRVDCPTSSPLWTAFVFAGDGDDTVSSSVAVNVDGGSGDDRLAGSPGADVLYGGTGRDVLRGAGGDDGLHDGRLLTFEAPDWPGQSVGSPVRSRVAPVRAARDAFDGGAGVDTLGYSGRRRGVVVDLSRDRDAGARDEDDSVRGLEGVVGTAGKDRLLGDELANSLDGGAGDDLLVGRAGDDRLELGAGSNRARGDAGDDSIVIFQTSQVERQRVACGSGRDEVFHLFPNDFAEDDCEAVFVGATIRALLPPRSGPRPPLASLESPLLCLSGECSARLAVRLARSPTRRLPRLKGLLLASARATTSSGGRIALTAHLSERGGRLLRRYRSLLVRISLTGTGALSEGGGAYLTRLRAPAP